jgi:hypothetical protein
MELEEQINVLEWQYTVGETSSFPNPLIKSYRVWEK